MRVALVSLALVLGCCGCTRVEYLEYRGIQQWPIGSAFVQDVDGVDVFEGLPDKAYTVIGMIDVYDDKPFFLSDDTKKKVLKLAQEHEADALVWLSDRAVTSGSLRMADQSRDPATLDTGRSSQPEVLVTNVNAYNNNAYSATQYKKALRSSLLLVKWKP